MSVIINPPSSAQIPHHIAIIMDGNGRWATGRGLPRVEGHRKGAETLKKITEAAHNMGVKVLTVFAFSSENWKRSADEVGGLLQLMRFYLRRDLKELVQKNICFKVVGKYQEFPKDIVEMLEETIEKTKNNTGIMLCVALNYGGRLDIVQAAQKFAQDCLGGQHKPTELTETLFDSYLYTADIASPDLLIRTSGELRISNFLLWQLSYAELHFTDSHWPDFTEQDLWLAVERFQNRQRRFGGNDVDAYGKKQSYLSGTFEKLKRKLVNE